VLVLLGVGSTPGLGVSTALTVGFEVSPVVLGGGLAMAFRISVVACLAFLDVDGPSAGIAPLPKTGLPTLGNLNDFTAPLTGKRPGSWPVLTDCPSLSL
jgi:hypothetical protein|tara:strand:- start:76 stop:372 length:297 start_codon:yes stop_codon:yes gene_type:complete